MHNSSLLLHATDNILLSMLQIIQKKAQVNFEPDWLENFEQEGEKSAENTLPKHNLCHSLYRVSASLDFRAPLKAPPLLYSKILQLTLSSQPPSVGKNIVSPPPSLDFRDFRTY